MHAELISIDPPLPRGLKWAERIPGLVKPVARAFVCISPLARLEECRYRSYFFGVVLVVFYCAGPRVDGGAAAKEKNNSPLPQRRSSRSFAPVPDHRSNPRTNGSVVVPSMYLVDVFSEFGLHPDVVPNITDLSQFRFRARGPLRPHLICTRGFHPYYRVDLVIRAFAEVQKVFPHARRDLAGTGPTESEIRDLVRQLQIRGVRFLGVVSRAEIGRVYDEADIFVNASSLDNMPVSVLEAFAAGTPVVSTAPGGNELSRGERAHWAVVAARGCGEAGGEHSSRANR